LDISLFKYFLNNKEKTMKTTTKKLSGLRILYLVALSLLLGVSLAAAQQRVPFKGSMQGNDQDIGSTDTTVTVLTTATGIGSHVGQFSFTQTWTVNETTGDITGSAQWTAANGDSFDTTLAGSGEPTDIPNVFRITEIHTITGGTGRFAGAQGSFTMERLASGVTFLTSGSFHGTLTPPGAAH
jgi:hypothetical protein